MQQHQANISIEHRKNKRHRGSAYTSDKVIHRVYPANRFVRSLSSPSRGTRAVDPVRLTPFIIHVGIVPAPGARCPYTPSASLHFAFCRGRAMPVSERAEGAEAGAVAIDHCRWPALTNTLRASCLDTCIPAWLNPCAASAPVRRPANRCGRCYRCVIGRLGVTTRRYCVYSGFQLRCVSSARGGCGEGRVDHSDGSTYTGTDRRLQQHGDTPCQARTSRRKAELRLSQGESSRWRMARRRFPY